MSDASAPSPPRAIASPCVMVCTVDGASGLCLGCLRTLQEIATWSRMTDEGRADVMADLPGRKSRIDPRLLGE
ncbi:DUF1289 domain-containing protein [Brevundimonas naejangsanensis]|uniref:DUF1289 domain-containing protein n=1 Tax=Brevundimonas naejangsanensis TaxID=588932 RepID=UPI00106BD1DA|nr:DUF1289 domain-containing protein [Brevundimonas naejangsanensis]QBQ49810.1 DUF1289 domain-containing protein [Brevundimonas naejangsanensis]